MDLKKIEKVVEQGIDDHAMFIKHLPPIAHSFSRGGLTELAIIAEHLGRKDLVERAKNLLAQP